MRVHEKTVTQGNEGEEGFERQLLGSARVAQPLQHMHRTNRIACAFAACILTGSYAPCCLLLMALWRCGAVALWRCGAVVLSHGMAPLGAVQQRASSP